MVASAQKNEQPKPRQQADDPQLNWRTCWYPIAFAVDLPINQPYGFSIFAEPFVLFRDRTKKLTCLADRCPHRLAKLSDGRVTDGHLECLYHGWQFGEDGTCVHIPHLSDGAAIPERACASSFPVQEHQGLIWVWADQDISPAPAMPPAIEGLETEGVFQVDTTTDLPFDHTFLVENLLDPAHVYISHDRTELTIRREDAAPLDMEVLATSVEGIQGRFRRADRPQAPWTRITFYAPMLVHYDFSNPAYGLVGGLGLYALPIAPGHSRILVRRYGSFFKRSFTLKPRWLEHLRQNKILEEDLAFIVAQDRFFRASKQPLKSAYFPLKTCDTFVMAHRRWLDRFGQKLPWYVGFSTTKVPAGYPDSHNLATRFERHTQSCQACYGAYEQLMTIKQAGWVGAVTSVALALVTEGQVHWVFVVSFLLAMVAIATANQLKSRF
ncbi:Rieske 2Fe-2S domain-containing protein [Leptolyngbya cf. ectocarpi LEGE 11479]|uniref:Rieske 2Fe-2S domain-containing protein n=1 Tax=Leptolyngbya cf. ectocarpi LEGE 11479 TaxID=1828722 RepID=A0A928ZZZ2_LEPEC|nr:Rieske 2Fe-2S domain-containing protein [Leptolyngbya ectocarpi]MBE9070605.1 Rieske 2Fe-2S domain-containing protein [Leptolyngbya cf. ectocarpi LEGE 11479]